MKRLILLVAALCLATSAAAQIASPLSTTSQLIDMCEAAEGKESYEAEAKIKSTACVGYLMGIMGAQAFARLRSPENEACEAFTYNGRDLVRAYLAKVSQLRATSKGQQLLRKMEDLPFVVAYTALEDAYPCDPIEQK